MDSKGNWTSEAVHQAYLARRRKAYRAAHPKPTAEEQLANILADARELQEELTSSAREKRYKVWQLGCNSGLAANWRSENILDRADYFETGTDRLEALTELPDFKYLFYRVSAQGDFLRGYIVFGHQTTMAALSGACSHLDYWAAMTKRYNLDRWVADSKLPCGKFYMSGRKPNYF